MTQQLLTSTVPGAIGRLFGHLQTVAAANPDLNLGVYVGRPVQTIANNYVSIGDPLGAGQLLIGYQSGWQGMRQTSSLRRTENYGLHCYLRIWDGEVNPLARLNEAFTAISALMNILADDIHGGTDMTNLDGSPGVLSPGGQWSIDTVDNTSTGAIDGKGWGLVFEFDVAVENVTLTAAP